MDMSKTFYNPEQKNYEVNAPNAKVSTYFVFPPNLQNGDKLPPLRIYAWKKNILFTFDGQYNAETDNLEFYIEGPTGFVYKISLQTDLPDQTYAWKIKRHGHTNQGRHNGATRLFVPRSLCLSSPTLISSETEVVKGWTFYGRSVQQQFGRLRLKVAFFPARCADNPENVYPRMSKGLARYMNVQSPDDKKPGPPLPHHDHSVPNDAVAAAAAAAAALAPAAAAAAVDAVSAASNHGYPRSSRRRNSTPSSLKVLNLMPSKKSKKKKKKSSKKSSKKKKKKSKKSKKKKNKKPLEAYVATSGYDDDDSGSDYDEDDEGNEENQNNSSGELEHCYDNSVSTDNYDSATECHDTCGSDCAHGPSETDAYESEDSSRVQRVRPARGMRLLVESDQCSQTTIQEPSTTNVPSRKLHVTDLGIMEVSSCADVAPPTSVYQSSTNRVYRHGEATCPEYLIDSQYITGPEYTPGSQYHKNSHYPSQRIDAVDAARVKSSHGCLADSLVTSQLMTVRDDPKSNLLSPLAAVADACSFAKCITSSAPAPTVPEGKSFFVENDNRRDVTEGYGVGGGLRTEPPLYGKKVDLGSYTSISKNFPGKMQRLLGPREGTGPSPNGQVEKKIKVNSASLKHDVDQNVQTEDSLVGKENDSSRQSGGAISKPPKIIKNYNQKFKYSTIQIGVDE